jgi:hypothetical protein
MKQSDYPRCMTCKHATTDKLDHGGEWLHCPKLKRNTGMIKNQYGKGVPYRCSPADCPRKKDEQ